MAAILSCALSYEFIAKKILAEYPAADKHEFYGEWVSGYASIPTTRTMRCWQT